MSPDPNKIPSLRRVISGGQSGVDQAALRAAQKCGLACGGWCPPGRATESGIIPLHFPVQETPEEHSPDAPDIPRSQRTEWNVRDSDATLILQPKHLNRKDPGTDWTVRCAERSGKLLLICDPAESSAAAKIGQWLRALSIQTLNVAGPSEATAPGIGDQAYALLVEIFSKIDVHWPRGACAEDA
ncbi:MAG: putative molybdenum carrier protein [Deltaproteobacteria bacterium]|nr:putative molybdenum carrier protein [Deltaproteobacteria bacterium]